MTKEQIAEITKHLEPRGAIERYLWDKLTQDGCRWGNAEMIVDQLFTAQCVNGSWGGLIYDKDIWDKLADPQWQDAINDALEEISHVDQPPMIESLTDLVWRAVDHTAAGMGCHLSSILETLKDEVAA